MNLALSNLAWDINNKPEFDIKNIECVLTKIKPWNELNESDIRQFKEKLNGYDLTPYAIQSLFYGLPKINGNEIILHFKKIIRFAQILGVKILVFGSPLHRKKDLNWNLIFLALDYELKNTDIKIIIEPNAHIFGGECFFTIEEIVDFIKFNNFKNIFTMIDTFNVIEEDLNPLEEFIKYKDYIQHIHVSNQNLGLISKKEFFKQFADLLRKNDYKGFITYEVMNQTNILNSIQTFKEIFE